MEEQPFTTENIINITIDSHKLSGSLNLLYQFHRANSSAIEILKKSITDLTTSTQDLKNSLTSLSGSFQSLETFKDSSQTKQKNLETQLNSIESFQTQAIKSIESKFPEISNQVLTELENLKNDHKQNLQQIKSSFQNKLKKSKTSILHSVELSRIEASDQLVDGKFERQNSENFENLSLRIGNVEDRLKRISIEEIFEKSENCELNQRILSKDPEEREDLLGELNLKYVQVIGEVGKLRELLRSFAKEPKEESIVLPALGYSTYSTRISELEKKIKVLDEQLKDLNKPSLSQSPVYINKRKTFTDYKSIEHKIQENSLENTDFHSKFEELSKKLSEKVSVWDLDNYFKDNIEKFLGIQENTIQNLESRIFKDLIDRSESIKSEVPSIPHENIELINPPPDLKNLIISINNTLSIHQATILEELQRFSSELKSFEAKTNKFSTNLQVQDLRTQDLLKRQQHFEDFQQEITSHTQKLQDRLNRNSLKSTEDLEKTLSHLQELEKVRSNVQEIIHKMQEGNKLHKRDYNTIQELKQLLESKTSKEEIDQKVDKNELKKMFRNLSKKVKNIQIDRVQSELKLIEEGGANDSMKKIEEPFITTRKLSSECLACGKDLTLQNKSISKLPSQYKVNGI